MKTLLYLAIIWGISLSAQAQENDAAAVKKFRKITHVSSAQFVYKNKTTFLNLSYYAGGCDPELNKPEIALELVSIKDTTPEWALKDNPNQIRQYSVVMNAVILEVKRPGPMCAMGYDLEVSADLRELFRKVAPKHGIDLDAKKAHYSVSINAPGVGGNTFFSAFD